jgi:carbon monoxide dehydrogenase subunit G
MSIDIKETFKVAAPIDKVWDFFLSPDNVVACMPGASLTEIVNAQRFIGAVKIKIGAVSAQYQGTITYQTLDKDAYTMQMLAEGSERGGGTVSGTIATQLVALPDGSGTEVRCASSVDLTGRIVQVGRGMIEGVSAQIIKKYVTNLRARLEVPGETAPAASPGTDEAHTAPATTRAAPPPLPPKEDSINIVAVVFTVFWNGLRNFFKRLFGR